MEAKTCQQCGEEFMPKKQWAEDDVYERGRFCSRTCKEISRNRSKNGQMSVRRWQFKTKYGITPEEYAEMFARQSGACAICKRTEPIGRTSKYTGVEFWLHVDHDHETGAVRGLLCSDCNSGLGKFQESADILRLAIEYLANLDYTP